MKRNTKRRNMRYTYTLTLQVEYETKWVRRGEIIFVTLQNFFVHGISGKLMIGSKFLT